MFRFIYLIISITKNLSIVAYCNVRTAYISNSINAERITDSDYYPLPE